MPRAHEQTCSCSESASLSCPGPAWIASRRMVIRRPDPGLDTRHGFESGRWLTRFQAGAPVSSRRWELMVLAVGWSSGEADADVGDDGAVLADEYRVQVE